MKISFVFYFHSSRAKILEQTLRILNKRENLSESEILLVCQDNYTEKILNYNVLSMNIYNYDKSKMCNFGVDRSSNEIVALLDSDRILPFGYFEYVFNNIKKNQFFSTWNMIKLKSYCNDEDIEAENFLYKNDFKCKINSPCEKNLFAGNTVFFKESYLSLGGMDENYKGYGYVDTDMTDKVISCADLETVWLDFKEIHLFHENDFSWNGKKIPFLIEVSTACNGLRYFKKWKKEPNKKALFNIERSRLLFKRLPKEIKKDFNYRILISKLL